MRHHCGELIKAQSRSLGNRLNYEGLVHEQPKVLKENYMNVAQVVRGHDSYSYDAGFE